MTRAQEPDCEIDYRSVGTPGASRTVVVLRVGPLATIDPAPHVTEDHDVRLILVHLDIPELENPSAYGGETPAGSTAAALAAIVQRENPGGAIGLVGERATTAIALGLAADLETRVDRLVIVAPLQPETPLDRDLARPVLAAVRADTLLVGSAAEPETLAAAHWLAGQIVDSDVANLPEDDVDSADGRVGLSDAWPRVLAHLDVDGAR